MMNLLFSAALSVFGLTAPTVAQPADWWWVAGDSHDSAAVFVDGSSVQRSGDSASVTAVRIARAGEASDASWHGRCSDRHADDEVAAIAKFACGTDDERMNSAAILPGLTPTEAARAIFNTGSRVQPTRSASAT